MSQTIQVFNVPTEVRANGLTYPLFNEEFTIVMPRGARVIPNNNENKTRIAALVQNGVSGTVTRRFVILEIGFTLDRDWHMTRYIGPFNHNPGLTVNGGDYHLLEIVTTTEV